MHFWINNNQYNKKASGQFVSSNARTKLSLLALLILLIVFHSRNSHAGAPGVQAAPGKAAALSAIVQSKSLYDSLMLMKQSPLNNLQVYVRPIKANSPVLATRKPIQADFFSQDDNRSSLMALYNYFFRKKGHHYSELTIEQAIDYLAERSQQGDDKARSLLVKLEAPASLYERFDDPLYDQKSSKLSGSGITDYVPLLGIMSQYFSSKTESDELDELHSTAPKTANLGHLLPQVEVSQEPIMSSDELLQDRRDRKQIKAMNSSGGGVSWLTKLVLGSAAIGVGTRVLALPTPAAAQVEMTPIIADDPAINGQGESGGVMNSLSGSVIVTGCPDGNCPGVLSFSQSPARHAGLDTPLCRIDMQQCTDPICTVEAPNCDFKATKTTLPGDFTKIEYTVTPESSAPLTVSYESGGSIKV